MHLTIGKARDCPKTRSLLQGAAGTGVLARSEARAFTSSRLRLELLERDFLRRYTEKNLRTVNFFMLSSIARSPAARSRRAGGRASPTHPRRAGSGPLAGASGRGARHGGHRRGARAAGTKGRPSRPQRPGAQRSRLLPPPPPPSPPGPACEDQPQAAPPPAPRPRPLPPISARRSARPPPLRPIRVCCPGLSPPSPPPPPPPPGPACEDLPRGAPPLCAPPTATTANQNPPPLPALRHCGQSEPVVPSSPLPLLLLLLLVQPARSSPGQPRPPSPRPQPLSPIRARRNARPSATTANQSLPPRALPSPSSYSSSSSSPGEPAPDSPSPRSPPLPPISAQRPTAPGSRFFSPPRPSAYALAVAPPPPPLPPISALDGASLMSPRRGPRRQAGRAARLLGSYCRCLSLSLLGWPAGLFS